MRYIWFNLIFFIGFLWSSCSETKHKNDTEKEHIDPKVEVIDSIVISKIDSLGLIFRIVSPRMVRSFHNRQYEEEYPQGLEVNFYNKKQVSQSGISAGYALVDNNGVTTLKKDVRILSKKGDQLETSYLIWDQYHRKIETDKLIRLVQSSGDTTYGFGLEATEDFSRFSIKKGFAGKRQFQNLKEKLNLGG